VSDADVVVLVRGRLRVEIALQPFELTIRHGGRRLVRSMGAWVAEGAVRDHFIQLTEGVVAGEELAPVERASAARVRRLAADRVLLAVELNGGRRARLEVRVLGEGDARVTFELIPEGEPLRVAADWRRRSDERFVGLGASHVAQGLGDARESERPLVATLWGSPRLGRAVARLADGTRITWHRGRWSVAADREVAFREID
jgi:hypothetical protein